MDRKVALVTGVCGQDGSYLADLLLQCGYKVVGMKRRTSQNDLGCAAHLEGKIEIAEGDLTDLPSILRLVKLTRPHEFYNLAAQSHVGTSFEQPVHTAEVTGLGVVNCLEAIRLSGLHTRFMQASTSELFGGLADAAYNEDSAFHPRSPYGVAKLFGYWITRNYREAYRMFAAQAICFNHESPRRGPNFVTRKITRAVARIKAGKQKELRLGNLDAKRDWGHAIDYVDAMMRIMNYTQPDDFVVSMGETHSVREFCQMAFKYAGLNMDDYVVIDPQFYRPAEVPTLLGDSSKLSERTGWRPRFTFDRLVADMVDSDLRAEGLAVPSYPFPASVDHHQV